MYATAVLAPHRSHQSPEPLIRRICRRMGAPTDLIAVLTYHNDSSTAACRPGPDTPRWGAGVHAVRTRGTATPPEAPWASWRRTASGETTPGAQVSYFARLVFLTEWNGTYLKIGLIGPWIALHPDDLQDHYLQRIALMPCRRHLSRPARCARTIQRGRLRVDDGMSVTAGRYRESKKRC